MYYLRQLLPSILFITASFICQAQLLQSPNALKIQGVNPYSIREADSLMMTRQHNSNVYPVNAAAEMQVYPVPTHKLAGIRLSSAIAGSQVAARVLAPGIPDPQNVICSISSGRDFLKQDSIVLFSGNPSMLPDGNIIVSGEFGDYSIQPFINDGGFCMKTTPDGRLIWAVLLDSADQKWDYLNLPYSLPLQNGDILLAGRTRNPIYRSDDLVLVRLDGNGNMLWLKTYQSRFWQGFNGSGDFLKIADLDEDPVTGDLYLTGNHWFGNTVVAKFAASNGNIMWSRTYRQFNTDAPFGLELKDTSMVLLTLLYNNSNQQYINILSLKKSSGDTIYTKRLEEIRNSYYDAGIYSTWTSRQTDQGHYLLSGPTSGYWEFPVYTGTIDLYHASTVELDENFNFVKSYGFKNRTQSNGYNTRITHFADGRGVFTMMKYISGYTAETQVALLAHDTIYHNRRRSHVNEGLPYEPPSLQLPDKGILNIKQMGDSTAAPTNGSRIDFYRVHTSDTASACMGVPDTTLRMWYRNFQPVNWNLMDSVTSNVFFESHPKTYNVFRFNGHQEPGCVIQSNCDSLDISMMQTVVCLGSSAVLKLSKNFGCGSFVPLTYDTHAIRNMGMTTDSTCLLQFNSEGTFIIYGSIQGCHIIKDSVQVTVLPAPGPVNLGADTSLCAGNSLVLHAGHQYVTYQWQDGSTDSVLTVTSTGTYSVQVTDACGNIYSDTLAVTPASFNFSIGGDRIKCNSDSLQLSAPAGFTNYQWQPDYRISSVYGASVWVNPLTDTFYYATAEKWPGCIVRDTVRITVNNSPAIHLGSDTSLCAGQSMLLNAGTGFASYAWSTGASSMSISIDQPGLYTVSATAANGCRSMDTLRLLAIKPLPVFNLGPDTTLCSGKVLALQFNLSQASYQWQNGSSSNVYTVTQPGLYHLQVTQQGCSSSDSIVVSYKPSPVLNLGRDSILCQGQSLLLDAGNTGALYQWQDGTNLQQQLQSQTGTYHVMVNLNGCLARDTISLSFDPQPLFTLGKDTSLCLGHSYMLAPFLNTPARYLWQDGSTGPSITITMEGLYVLTATNHCGHHTDSLQIKTGLCKILMPDAFTPNNDGLNDIFRVKYPYPVKQFSFVIYNRYGQPVFETSDINRGWDGRYLSSPQETGAYTWIIRIRTTDDIVEQQSGTVLLVR